MNVFLAEVFRPAITKLRKQSDGRTTDTKSTYRNEKFLEISGICTGQCRSE